jgi:hypothetical protein
MEQSRKCQTLSALGKLLLPDRISAAIKQCKYSRS